jgi:serine protease
LPTPVPAPTPAPSPWKFCANEGQYCSVPGRYKVRYGANGVYHVRSVRRSVKCSSAVFGDPLPGVVKHCDSMPR